MAQQEKLRINRARTGDEQEHNRGFITQSVVLGSHTAQIIFAQTYSRTESALYSLGVVMRNIAPDNAKDEADRVLELIDQRMESYCVEIANEIKRLNVLLKHHGIRDQVQFSAPQSVTAQISSPQVAKYLSLVRDIDKIISRMTLLWVHGVVSNQELGKADRRWVANYRRWSLQLRSVNRSALRSANMQRQEVKDAMRRRVDQRLQKRQHSAEKKAAAAKQAQVEIEDLTKTVVPLNNNAEAQKRVDLKTIEAPLKSPKAKPVAANNQSNPANTPTRQAEPLVANAE